MNPSDQPHIDKSPIGLIAGNGGFPVELLKAAQKSGIPVYTIALNDEADPQVESLSIETTWLHVGELGKIIKRLKHWQVKRAVFIGGIKRVRLFTLFKTDIRTIKLLAKMRSIRDDELLRRVIEELASEGIETITPALILPELVVSRGRITNAALSAQQLKDAEVAWRVAETIGSLDIGQTIAAKTGTVVAVEAVEGTDQAIIRAGKLAGTGFTVVKLPKPNQDMRVDIPSIGVETIRVLAESGGKALILKSSGAMMLDPQSVKHLADKYSISIEIFDSLDDILGYKN